MQEVLYFAACRDAGSLSGLTRATLAQSTVGTKCQRQAQQRGGRDRQTRREHRESTGSVGIKGRERREGGEELVHWVISVQDTGRTDESHRPAARREMYGIEQKTRVRETVCVRENRTSAET